MTLRAVAAMVVVSAVMLVSLAWLSQIRVSTDPGVSIVRLSWRTEAINVETCRVLSEEELARVPAHMRRAEECEGRRVDYEVALAIDGIVMVTDTVSPAGARRDRPVYVFHDQPVQPGTHSVAVGFMALVPADYDVGDQSMRLEWAESVTLSPGQIALVTLDPEGRRLIRR